MFTYMSQNQKREKVHQQNEPSDYSEPLFNIKERPFFGKKNIFNKISYIMFKEKYLEIQQIPLFLSHFCLALHILKIPLMAELLKEKTMTLIQLFN